jgi:hypothetical protein
VHWIQQEAAAACTSPSSVAAASATTADVGGVSLCVAASVSAAGVGEFVRPMLSPSPSHRHGDANANARATSRDSVG